MSESAIESRPAGVKSTSPSGGAALKATAFTPRDHTQFVDLLLQETAMVAREALSARSEFPRLARETLRAVELAEEAVTSVAILGTTGPDMKRVFRSLDGAFMSLFDLQQVLHHDVKSSALAEPVRSALVRLNQRFGPAGWKSPKGSDEGHARMATAEKDGALVLSTSEKGQLGQLHLRVARQHLLGGWSELSGGNFASVAADAARELRRATNLLLDPRLMAEARAAAAEMEATEQVLERVVLYMEMNDKASLAKLADLAAAADGACKFVGRSPRWASRIAGTSTQAASGSSATTQPLATDKNGVPVTHSNHIDKGAPRNEPPADRHVAKEVYRRRVHLKDTNLVNEYLGYVELKFTIVRTEAGQIYATDDIGATFHGNGRATDYLSITCTPITSSDLPKDAAPYADVVFNVQVSGPSVTATSQTTGGIELSAPGDKVGLKGTASASKSTAESIRGAKPFHRAYRITGAEAPQAVTYAAPDGTMKNVTVWMYPQLLSSTDIEDWDVDNNGGSPLDRKWTIHSYDDD